MITLVLRPAQMKPLFLLQTRSFRPKMYSMELLMIDETHEFTSTLRRFFYFIGHLCPDVFSFSLSIFLRINSVSCPLFFLLLHCSPHHSILLFPQLIDPFLTSLFLYSPPPLFFFSLHLLNHLSTFCSMSFRYFSPPSFYLPLYSLNSPSILLHVPLFLYIPFHSPIPLHCPSFPLSLNNLFNSPTPPPA